jgi:hypothetical protein
MHWHASSAAHSIEAAEKLKADQLPKENKRQGQDKEDIGGAHFAGIG